MTHDSLTLKVARYFKSKRYTWIRAEALMRVGGAMAWRTRVSNARRRLGLPIENRQRRVGKRIVSEYRLGRRRAA